MVEALRRLEPLVGGRSVRALPARRWPTPARCSRSTASAASAICTRRSLPHLRGYDGVGPVRIGNAAYVQRQHDVDGEMVLCLETILTDPRVVWEDPIAGAAARAAGRRGDRVVRRRRHRALGVPHAAAPLHVLEGDVLGGGASRRRARRVSRHARTRARVARVGRRRSARSSSTRAYNEELGFFTQAFDGALPDASNLLLPTLGLDRSARSALRLHGARLREACSRRTGLMLRYKHPDDFGDTTSAFSICSFWWVEALAMMGEVDEAVALFHRLEKYANPLGLVFRRHRPDRPARCSATSRRPIRTSA